MISFFAGNPSIYIYISYIYIYIYMGVFKNMGKPPNHPCVHRVLNHYVHHPFWGKKNPPIFGSTPMAHINCKNCPLSLSLGERCRSKSQGSRGFKSQGSRGLKNGKNAAVFTKQTNGRKTNLRAFGYGISAKS